MTDTTTVETVQADDIVRDVLVAASSYAATTEIFLDAFVFAGRSLREWSGDLAVEIPKDLTPDGLKDCLIQLGRKIQQAYDLHAYATSLHNALSRGGSMKKSNVVAALVENYRINNAKRPGEKVLDRMADSYLGNTPSNEIVARITKEFFRDKRDALIETRKCLESFQYLLHMEQKLQE